MNEKLQKNRSSVSIKIISMGAPGVGKSCLIKRYCEKRFVSKYMATLGIDFGVTTIEISNGERVKVNIFDMGGESFFYEVRNEFYKGTHGALLVYDVTDPSSYDNLTVWLSEMQSHMPSKEDMGNVVITVCANKVDLGSAQRQVSSMEGRLWAESRGFLYYETSALANDSVFEMFESLVEKVVAVQSGNEPARIHRSDLNYTSEQVNLVERVLNKKNSSVDVLGVKPHSTREDIIKAYKHLAVLLHPDKNAVPGSEEAFKKLCSAKDELLNHR